MSNYEELNAKINSEDFKTFCNENIIPEVKKLNLKKVKSSSILILCFGIYGFTLFKFAPLGIINAFCFYCTAAIFFLILCHFGILITKNYKTNVKESVFKQLLSYIDNFEAENSPNFADIVSTGLFKNSNRICCDDAIKGEYKSTPVKIYEICVDKAAIHFDSITGKNLFNGILMKLPYKTANDTSVIILPGKKETENEEYSPVKIDNEEFSSYFSVFSSDSESAAQNIDEKLINALITLAKNGHDKDLSLSIEHGEINIAILSNKDRFEVSFLKSTEDIENYKSVLKDVTELLEVADLFIQA